MSIPNARIRGSVLEDAKDSDDESYSRVYAVFDNTLVVYDDERQPIRYLVDPHAERYIEAPGESVLDGMLPPEEFEVRKALVEMKFFTEMYSNLGALTRVFRRDKYIATKQLAMQKQRALADLVNSGPLYKAAIRRIVNAMPEGNGGREALRSYTA